MILVTGDTHGDIDYRKLDNHKLVSKFSRLPDYLLVAGDFGLPWSDDPDNPQDVYLKKWYEEKPYQIIVIPGNHENYNRIEAMPQELYNGALVRRYGKNIVFVEKNHVLQLEKKTFYCLGGAASIDKDSRILYRSWWPQEDATYADFLRAESFLKRVKKVDYVITHTAPEKVIKTMGGMDKYDGTAKLLTYLNEKLIFKHWYYGHFHTDETFSRKYTCLYNEVKEIV